MTHKISTACRWVKIEWEESAEAWMVDIRMENREKEDWLHFAFTDRDLKELHKKIGRTLRRGKKP